MNHERGGELEGLARGLKKLVRLPAPHYGTLSLRLPKLDLDLGYDSWAEEPIVIAVAVDIKTKQAVTLEVTNDRTHDGEMMEPLVKGLKQGSRCERMPIRTVVGKEVRTYLRDPPGWKKQTGYGQRWMAETHLEDSSGSSAS